MATLTLRRMCMVFMKDEETGEVTDMCSFYHLPSTVLKHEKYKSVNAAYSFYNVATTVTPTELLQDLLVLAKNVLISCKFSDLIPFTHSDVRGPHQDGFDVFNALDVQKNSESFQKLRFGIGDGHLQVKAARGREVRWYGDKGEGERSP